MKLRVTIENEDGDLLARGVVTPSPGWAFTDRVENFEGLDDDGEEVTLGELVHRAVRP